MLRLGVPIDEKNEVKLYRTGKTVHTETLPKSGLNVSFKSFQFDNDLRRGTGKPLLPNNNDYTFRKYGKLKNFAWYDEEILVTARSHLEYIRNSPKLSINYVDEEVLAGRVYGFSFVSSASDTEFYLIGTSFGLRIVRLNAIRNWVDLYRHLTDESISDMEKLLYMIADADVIALSSDVGRNDYYGCDIILLVDDDTKILLDKLMTIYRDDGRMRGYLTKHDITLGMVLDNLDLYHCLSYGV